MVDQIAEQRKAFEIARYPVSILQGEIDRGQPLFLFDGTLANEIIESPKLPWYKSFDLTEYLMRKNTTHKLKIVRSSTNDSIGPKAEDFFPNSPFVKFRILDGIGHFSHLEAPDAVIDTMKELLSVPV